MFAMPCRQALFASRRRTVRLRSVGTRFESRLPADVSLSPLQLRFENRNRHKRASSACAFDGTVQCVISRAFIEIFLENCRYRTEMLFPKKAGAASAGHWCWDYTVEAVENARPIILRYEEKLSKFCVRRIGEKYAHGLEYRIFV